MSGFLYNGRHSKEFNLHYIPSPQSRLQSTPVFDMREETVTGKAGGYYYGRQTEIREFSLECYFENISLPVYEDMIRWLYNDLEGELIFDERPYVSYTVRPWKNPTGKVYSVKHEIETGESYSGTLNVFFKAYDPFGEMNYISYDTCDEHGAARTCGIIRTDEMPPAIVPGVGSFLIYNPGTEMTDTIIRIGGTAPNGVSIVNETTGDHCLLLSLPEDPNYIEMDSSSGSIRVKPAYPDDMAFEYHDDGYICLAPCTPYKRNVMVGYAAGSNEATFSTIRLSNGHVGQYIRIGGEWVRIASIIDEHNAIINKTMDKSGTEETIVATMNEITVSGEGATITKLEIDYKPRVR